MIKDEHIPFTCAITKEYCGSNIEYVYITADDKVLASFPISPTVLPVISKKIAKRVANFMVAEIIKEQEKK